MRTATDKNNVSRDHSTCPHRLNTLYYNAQLTLKREHDTYSVGCSGQVVRESHQGDPEGDTRLEVGQCVLPHSRVYHFIRSNLNAGIVEHEPSGADFISLQYPGKVDSS